MAMGDLKAKTPTEVLDVLGRVCPYPLVLTKKQIEKMGSGQLLKILCDAPASAEDSIPRFAEKSGYPIEVEKVGDHWEIYIEKQ
jgi:tRNA 2-thiouridine synthesizing protein A